MAEFTLIMIRSIFSFIILLILARILGKRQISQLTFFDYCVGITIGSIAAEMSLDQNIKILNGFTSLIIWALLPLLLSIISLKSQTFQQLANSRPQIIIKKGKLLEDSMKKAHITINELMALLREKDVFNVSDVEMAILETNGKLSVMKKTSNQPITPQMLSMSLKQENTPTLLIVDGQVLEENLSILGYTQEWLQQEIQKYGAKQIKDIFLAQIDSNGNLFIDTYDDQEINP